MINKIVFILFFPLSLLYGLTMWIRNKLFDMGCLRSVSFDVPVISVGNITVGGTGKTPHVEYLIRILVSRYTVAVLSRGYGRKTRGFRMVDVGSRATDVGDEPCQIKNKFPEVMVAVDERRVHGMEQLLALSPRPEVILLDDAFQHRYVRPGLSVLLIDSSRPLYKDTWLPSGRLRESVSGKSRADILVVTKMRGEVTEERKLSILAMYSPEPRQKVFFSTFIYSEPRPLFSQKAAAVVDWREVSVLLVTGIARPEPLREWLEGKSKQVVSLAFSDHHTFTPSEISGINAVFSRMDGLKLFITTEKDAVRLKEVLPVDLHPYVYVAPVQVAFLPSDGISFDDSVSDFMTASSQQDY